MTSPIKIAVLDDYQNCSVAQFDRLDKSKFKIQVFQDTLLAYNHPTATESIKAEIVKRLEPFTVISTMRERTPFPGELLRKLPNLKLLLTTGLRNSSLDLTTAKELGIRVAGAAGVGRSDKPKASPVRGPDTTTQHAIALLLGIARNISTDDASVKSGGWQTTLATGLGGKTCGIVGLGRLGVAVAKILHVAFGMKIVAWSSSLTQEAADEKAKAAGIPVTDEDGEKAFKVVGKETLFKTADFISMHYVLSPRSKGVVSRSDLDLMKPTAFFINTSRSGLVVEKDLLDVLRAGKIRGAAVDVYELEPLPVDSEWRSNSWGTNGRSRVLVSPHMGFVEDVNLANWYEETVENIERWDSGKDMIAIMA